MPVSAVFGLLWNCSDILPSGGRSTLADLGVELSGRWTYAAAARQLRPYVASV